MDKTPAIDDLIQRAIEIASRESGQEQLQVLDLSSETLHTGREIYLVRFTGEAEPNGEIFEVYLDAEGVRCGVDDLDPAFLASFLAPRPVDTVALALSPPQATPITVSPSMNVLTLRPGDAFSEVITVDIPKGSGVRKVDVYFLADATGSMGSEINAVKIGANAIISQLMSLGLDMHFGVGHYRDLPNTNPPFIHQLAPTDPTGNLSAITAAINAWLASGGNDAPEGQLYALDQLAQPPGGSVGWRAGAKRIVVWFGDQPGHDPICQAISGLAYDITEASATAKLVAEDIIVLAISTGFGAGLDGNPKFGKDYVAACGSPGGSVLQGTHIADATGGKAVSGVNPANIAQIITDLVTNAATTIGSLKLVAAGGTVPFVETVSPAGGYGPLTLDVDQQKTFDVTFLGNVPCTDVAQAFNGTLDIVADGVVVAQKTVEVTVPKCGPTPKLCPGLVAPADKITEALENPEQVAGWLQTCNKNLGFDPIHNPYRTRLQLLYPGQAYNELNNPLVYKCGCS